MTNGFERTMYDRSATTTPYRTLVELAADIGTFVLCLICVRTAGMMKPSCLVAWAYSAQLVFRSFEQPCT